METFLKVLIGIGLVFNLLGVVGMLRFPDVFTRLHGTTKNTTFGSIFIGAAVILYGLDAYLRDSAAGDMLSLAAHAFIAMLVMAITNATGSHAIAQAAHRRGQKPARAVVDRLAEARTQGKGGAQ
jgi:multicomponent Na+:H+ antiporter subunit G